MKMWCWLMVGVFFLINGGGVKAISASYFDDFDGGTEINNWEVIEEPLTNPDHYRSDVREGKFYLYHDTIKRTRRTALKGIDWGSDFRVETVGRILAGESGAAFGLLLGYTDDSTNTAMYRIQVFPFEKKLILRYWDVSSKSQQSLVDEVSEAIKTGDNKIVAERKGEVLKIYINDILVKEITKTWPNGRMGLMVLTGDNKPMPTEASFDYIKITKGDVGNNCPLGNKGDINCDNKINKDDFETWKASFLEAQKNVSQLIKKIKYLAWK